MQKHGLTLMNKKIDLSNVNTKPQSPLALFHSQKDEELLDSALISIMNRYLDKVDAKLSNKAEKSLQEKTEKSGIVLEKLKDIYQDGIAEWYTKQEETFLSEEQWAFNRVNAYINKIKENIDIYKLHCKDCDRAYSSRTSSQGWLKPHECPTCKTPLKVVEKHSQGSIRHLETKTEENSIKVKRVCEHCGFKGTDSEYQKGVCPQCKTRGSTHEVEEELKEAIKCKINDKDAHFALSNTIKKCESCGFPICEKHQKEHDENHIKWSKEDPFARIHEGKKLNEFIRSVGGGKYIVVSHKGKRLSKPSSKEAAERRLTQIEYFKTHKEEHGAGFVGTSKLVEKYAKVTPGKVNLKYYITNILKINLLKNHLVINRHYHNN